ncbi:glucosamine 6-phosphate N-acetyltransferase isoform X2 [Neofelis nebulosa]|uniref:glucosamine 6-phosphate N-acetyltransferase isoform X2 n=1 Tax=Neofelis nebulosa TaxID=61452 RepID=UPI00272CCBA2|nr:glucosamine 6-phosphate N-acetyltransferase isoform X2 [Neofelis nebulosa]
MKPDETPMFDPSLLKEVDWSQNTATFSPAISPTHPGEGLVLRPLCTADLNRGFFKVLGQLTETGVVNPEQFMKSFEHMKKSGDYYVTVVEDVTLGQIVATATLIIEHKFIHSCAKRGRVEDVVVSDECRGKQLGKLERASRGGAEKERDTQNPKQVPGARAVSTEPNAGLELTSHEIMT